MTSLDQSTSSAFTHHFGISSLLFLCTSRNMVSLKVAVEVVKKGEDTGEVVRVTVRPDFCVIR
jgi:hypothetical protein